MPNNILETMQKPKSNKLQRLSVFLFGITVVLIPFRYRILIQTRPSGSIYRDYTDFLLFASDIFLIATLIIWILSFVGQTRRLKPGPAFLTWPLIGVTAMAIISIIVSHDRPLSIYHSIRLLILLGLYFYIINEITSIGQLIFPLAGMVLIQAIVGIGQVLDQHSLGLQLFGEYELDPAWSGVSVVSAGGVRSLRAYGLSDHPNILGGIFTFALLMLIMSCVGKKSNWYLLNIGVIILGSLGLFFTYSRSAWLGMLVGIGMIVFLLYRSKKFEKLKRLFILGITIAIIGLPFVWSNSEILGIRFGFGNSFEQVPTENRSIRERQALNSAASKIFADNGVFGVGIGTIPQAIQTYYPEFAYYYQPAHIVLLDVAAETGIFGVLFYSILLVSPWLAMLFNKKITLSPNFIGVSAALLASSVIGFFDYYTWLLIPGRFMQWIIWGFWGKFYSESLEIESDV